MSSAMVRQSALIVFGGGVSAATILAVSRVQNGWLGAAMLLLGLVIVAITVGLAADTAATLIGGRVRCRSCTHVKTQVADIWLCPVCDRVAG